METDWYETRYQNWTDDFNGIEHDVARLKESRSPQKSKRLSERDMELMYYLERGNTFAQAWAAYNTEYYPKLRERRDEYDE